MGLGRRLPVVCPWLERITVFRARSYSLAAICLQFNSARVVFQSCNHKHVSCCRFSGHTLANRGRGEGNQVHIPYGSALSMFRSNNNNDPNSSPSHHCCHKVKHFLSNTATQNCKNAWWVWCFWIPHRNWASITASASIHLKPVPGISATELDERNREGKEEDGEENSDQIIERNEGINLEKNEHSAVDFMDVERVYKVVEEQFESSDGNMEAVLDQYDVKLSHLLVCHVLDRFSHARKPAFRFFNWAGQQVGFSHNSLTYNAMMSILARTRQYVSMWELMEEMRKRGGSVLTIETFEIAIKAFAGAREMKKAVNMFDLMERYNFDEGATSLGSRSLHLSGYNTTFNFLLDTLGRAKLAKEAHMLFERMRERFPPDAKTYSVLLSGWCKVKNMIQAGKVWNQMVDEGFKPDLVTHNIMLEGLFNGRREYEALKLFDLMKENGPSPDSKTYTILIGALSKLQKMEEAFKFFAEMQEYDCPINAAVYTSLITGYATSEKLDEAYSLLQEMEEKGIPHDWRAYNALIKVMAILQKPDEATKLYDKMIKCGFQPTIHTYNTLMKLYFLAGKAEMGFAIWDQMARNLCCPDVKSYTLFIGGLIREGRSQEACALIESMIGQGMEVPRFDYNKFLADFGKAGRPDILEELATKMKHAGKSDVSELFLRYSQKIKSKMKKRAKTRRGHSSKQSEIRKWWD